MAASNQVNGLTLKASLLEQIQQLDRQQALLPSSYPSIDTTVEQLESLTKVTQPLQPENWPALVGTWELLYASRGTVVTRRITSSMPFKLPKAIVKQVWQILLAKDAILVAENGANLEIPGLGCLWLLAKGTWNPIDLQSAKVTFNEFVFQIRFQWLSWTLPEIEIPVPQFWRREALWITSYLDENLRVGRGATGNLFVFKKQ